MSVYRVYCRLYQGIFKTVSPLLGWREPELVEGAGSVLALPGIMKRERISRVLVVTDAVLAKLGIMDPLLAAMKKEGIEYAVYDGTVPNPTVANIEEALKVYRERSCQAILAFGGGSSMDCAKGVGARVARPAKGIADMKGVLKVMRRIPPLFAVPTTAGTGSEATLAAVISNPDTHEKYPVNDHVLIPHFAALDPELTLGLPPHITSTTGMDALTHAVEAYIGRSNTKETERDAIEATRLIFGNLTSVYANGKDVAGRGRLLKASYLAGKAFTRAYVGYVHAMAHALGGFYGVPHGLANSVILPYVLDRYGEAAHGRLARLARESSLVEKTLPDAEAAAAFVAKVRAMNREMGIPEKIDAIRKTDVKAMAERAHAEANPLYPVPAILGKADLEGLFLTVAGAGGGAR